MCSIVESGKDKIPLVVIQCLTYNHALYIRQCLDGFVMQKTSFPFLAIIHDDASTDGTADIVREYESKYPHIIKGIYQKENQYKTNPTAIGKAIDPFLTGKYIALCEGDDYWIDPLKLQKQVDFLEANPEYGLVYTKVHCYEQLSGKFLDDLGKKIETIEQLIIANVIPTVTTIFRCEYVKKYLEFSAPYNKMWKMGDYPLWLYISTISKIYFFDYSTAVYRILPKSASHSDNIDDIIEFENSKFKIQLLFASNYCDRKMCYELQVRNDCCLYLLTIMHKDKHTKFKEKLQNYSYSDFPNKYYFFVSRNYFLHFLLKISIQNSFFYTILKNTKFFFTEISYFILLLMLSLVLFITIYFVS